MKRNLYHPAIGCSCGLHTWPTLLQSVCNGIEIPHPLLIRNKHQTKGPFDSKFAAMHVPFIWLFVPKIVFKYSGPRKTPLWKLVLSFMNVNRIFPDGAPRFAASHLGLFCLPMSYKRRPGLYGLTDNISSVELYLRHNRYPLSLIKYRMRYIVNQPQGDLRFSNFERHQIAC